MRAEEAGGGDHARHACPVAAAGPAQQAPLLEPPDDEVVSGITTERAEDVYDLVRELVIDMPARERNRVGAAFDAETAALRAIPDDSLRAGALRWARGRFGLSAPRTKGGRRP